MGELVVGRPALQVKSAMSVALDMVSVMSLLYRAVPGSGLDSWLVQTRRNLSWDLQEDLDLLHGFSGRLLYYMEEPIMRFEPLQRRPGRRHDRRTALVPRRARCERVSRDGDSRPRPRASGSRNRARCPLATTKTPHGIAMSNRA